MKEIILQKSNFRCRENIYICRPLRRIVVQYVEKKTNLISAFKQESGHRYVGQVKAFDLGDVQLFDAVDERLK